MREGMGCPRGPREEWRAKWRRPRQGADGTAMNRDGLAPRVRSTDGLNAGLTATESPLHLP